MILTSNRARPLSEALRRRCAYLHIDYPDMEKELAILRKKLPHVDDRLAAQVALAVQKLRSTEAILKKPSIAETLDWAAALDALGIAELTPEAIRQTAGFVLKSRDRSRPIAAAARGTAMAEPTVYLEKLSAFARILRMEGLPVSPRDTEDGAAILTQLGFADRETVKTALMTIYAKSREEQLKFSAAFDGFFLSEEAVRAQARERAEQEQQRQSITLILPSRVQKKRRTMKHRTG